MAKINEFEISMVCYNEDNKYTLEEINDMLIEWAESKDIFLGGSVKPCVVEECSDENAALPLHDVSNNEVAVCCSNCKNDYNKDFHKICKHCYLGSKFEAN